MSDFTAEVHITPKSAIDSNRSAGIESLTRTFSIWPGRPEGQPNAEIFEEELCYIDPSRNGDRSLLFTAQAICFNPNTAQPMIDQLQLTQAPGTQIHYSDSGNYSPQTPKALRASAVQYYVPASLHRYGPYLLGDFDTITLGQHTLLKPEFRPKKTRFGIMTDYQMSLSAIGSEAEVDRTIREALNLRLGEGIVEAVYLLEVRYNQQAVVSEDSPTTPVELIRIFYQSTLNFAWYPLTLVNKTNPKEGELYRKASAKRAWLAEYAKKMRPLRG